MKNITTKIYLVLFLVISSTSTICLADEATAELFKLMDKGGCEPSSLTIGSWTISSPPVGTHGELTWGDELVFEQLDAASNFSNKSSFSIRRNGAPWISDSGWEGSCARDGNLSVYVVSGFVELDGCMHELAIGRLDHDDNLGNRVEIIFQDKFEKHGEICTHGGDPDPLHPGHAHGNN